MTQFTDQRVPVSLGVLLDASDSMRGQPVVDARVALDRFVGELLFPEDEAFVATFNHSPRLAARWKRPTSSLVDVLKGLQPSGGTAIYDSLAETARLFERRNNTRAAFVLISDGADTASDRTLHQALDAIRRSDAFVYAIAIDPPDARASTRVNPEALREITSLSGGYTEVVRSAADLGPATARIADELNKQYTLGYSSTRPPDGTWRALRVRVRSKAEYLRARPPRLLRRSRTPLTRRICVPPSSARPSFPATPSAKSLSRHQGRPSRALQRPWCAVCRPAARPRGDPRRHRGDDVRLVIRRRSLGPARRVRGLDRHLAASVDAVDPRPAVGGIRGGRRGCWRQMRAEMRFSRRCEPS